MMFLYCTALTKAVIGNSVTSIGEFAFMGCEELTDVTIGYSVTSIDDFAFAYCYKLKNITLPSSLSTLNYSVFEQCDSVTDIFCFAATPPSIQGSTFSSYSATLHVLEESVEAYTAADEWKNFNIIGDLALYAMLGDTNCDGIVNISDVTLLVSYVMGDESIDINIVKADLNGDSDINITDVTILVNMVLNSAD
jgi:hypothetical protein